MNRASPRQNVRSWRQFIRIVRGSGCELFAELPRFSDAILVTGCQRSGTTALARVLTQSDGMVNYWFGRDDELDAALILSGYVPHESRGRYCFQTTYMYDSHDQYRKYASEARIVWVVRNPFSVVWSMLYNWKRFALNELFEACGREWLPETMRRRAERLGTWSVPPLYRACAAYAGKLQELPLLKTWFDADKLMVIDYEDLVSEKVELLPVLYDKLELAYKPEYADRINARSLGKAKRLSERQRAAIQEICVPAFEMARACITISRRQETG